MKPITKRLIEGVCAQCDITVTEYHDNFKSPKRKFSEARKVLICALYHEVGLSMTQVSVEVGKSRTYVDKVARTASPVIMAQAKSSFEHMFGSYSANAELEERVTKLEADMLRVRQSYEYVVQLYRDKAVQ